MERNEYEHISEYPVWRTKNFAKTEAPHNSNRGMLRDFRGATLVFEVMKGVCVYPLQVKNKYKYSVYHVTRGGVNFAPQNSSQI